MIKKLLLAAAIAIALPACQPGSTLGTLVVGVQNPITRNEVAAIEQTYITLLIPVRAYVNLPTCTGTQTFLSNGCGESAMKTKLRSAVAQARGWRRELVQFVANNDQVNALTAYNELTRVLDILRTAPPTK